jgi:hypothetical protein
MEAPQKVFNQTKWANQHSFQQKIKERDKKRLKPLSISLSRSLLLYFFFLKKVNISLSVRKLHFFLLEFCWMTERTEEEKEFLTLSLCHPQRPWSLPPPQDSKAKLKRPLISFFNILWGVFSAKVFCADFL